MLTLTLLACLTLSVVFAQDAVDPAVPESTVTDAEDGDGKLLTIKGANLPAEIELTRGTKLCVVNGDEDAVHYVYSQELAFVPKTFQYPVDYLPQNKIAFQHQQAVGGTSDPTCFRVVQPKGEYVLTCEVHGETQFDMTTTIKVVPP